MCSISTKSAKSDPTIESDLLVVVRSFSFGIALRNPVESRADQGPPTLAASPGPHERHVLSVRPQRLLSQRDRRARTRTAPRPDRHDLFHALFPQGGSETVGRASATVIGDKRHTQDMRARFRACCPSLSASHAWNPITQAMLLGRL